MINKNYFIWFFIMSIMSINLIGYSQTENTLNPSDFKILEGTKTDPIKLNYNTLIHGPLYVVVNSPYQYWSKTGTNIQILAYSPSGFPASKADVYINDRLIGKTNSNGTLIVNFNPRLGGEKEYQGSTYEVKVISHEKNKNRMGNISLNVYPRSESFSFKRIYVYTDRKRYILGDTIHVRLVAWELRDDYHPLENKQINITLESIFDSFRIGSIVTTDSYGVGSVDIPIPQTITSGRYRIEVLYGDTSASSELEIAEFEPSSIEIKHNLPSYITPKTKNIVFFVQLNHLSQKAIKSGKIDLKLQYNSKIIWNKSVEKINDNVKYQFDIPDKVYSSLLTKMEDQDELNLDIEAQTELGEVSFVDPIIKFYKSPYLAIIEPQSDQVEQGTQTTVYVKLNDIDGNPVKNKEIILESKGIRLEQTERTNEKGIAVFLFKIPQKIEVSDEDSQPGNKFYENHLEVDNYEDDQFDDMEQFNSKLILKAYLKESKVLLDENIINILPGNLGISAHFQDKNIYEKTEVPINIEISPEYILKEKVVHFDVTDSSGSIINSYLLPVTKQDDHYIAESKIKINSWGTALLNFYTLASPKKVNNQFGILTYGIRSSVLAKRGLKITLDGIPQKVRPGQRFRVIANISDEFGKDHQSELGIMAVNRAFLMFGHPFSISPIDHFFRPTFRSMATSGEAMMSWPVLARNWGDDQYDIALPPFGYREGEQLELWYEKALRLNEMDLSLSGFGTGAGGSAMGYAGLGIGKEPRIIIRNKFPPTPVWIPGLKTDKNGKAVFEIEMPDTLTTHELSVLASTKDGFIGIAQKDILTSQPIAGRMQLPDKIIAGDKISYSVYVDNNTDKNVIVDGQFLNDGIKSASFGNMPVNSNSTIPIKNVIQFNQPGRHEITLKIKTDDFVDISKQTINVLPAGNPDIKNKEFQLLPDKTFDTDISSGRTYTQAFLKINTPIVMNLPDINKLWQQTPDIFVVSDSAKILISIYTYNYLLKNRKSLNITSEHLFNLQSNILNHISRLIEIQNYNGGWGWFWNNYSSPYPTIYNLEAICTAQNNGFYINEDKFYQAINFLTDNLKQNNGYISTQDISWWEGDSKRVSDIETIHLYQIIKHCDQFGYDVNKINQVTTNNIEINLDESNDAINKLHKQILETARTSNDQYLLAEALKAILNEYQNIKLSIIKNNNNSLSQNGQKIPINHKQLESYYKNILLPGADKLGKLRDNLFRQGMWFAEYGGESEGVATQFEIYNEFSPQKAQEFQKTAYNYLLARIPSFGAWHNMKGTVALFRILNLLNGIDQDSFNNSLLEVKINNKSIIKGNLDNKSILQKLDFFDISPYLIKGGENHVTIDYKGGKIPLTGQIYVKTWGALGAVAENNAYFVNNEREKFVKVQLGVDSNIVKQGGKTQINLLLSLQKNIKMIKVNLPSSSITKINENSLDNFNNNTVQFKTIGNNTYAFIENPDKSIRINYELEGIYDGEANLSPVIIDIIDSQPQTFYYSFPLIIRSE